MTGKRKTKKNEENEEKRRKTNKNKENIGPTQLCAIISFFLYEFMIITRTHCIGNNPNNRSPADLDHLSIKKLF